MTTTKPSSMQRFFARSWPWQLAFWGGSLGAGILLLAPSYSRRTGSIVTILAAAMSGALITAFFLHILWRLRAWLNGAPFRKGDVVQILAGKHQGRIARVYDEWIERNEVRVDVGKQAKRDVEDVFSFVEISRIEDDEPIAERNEATNPE